MRFVFVTDELPRAGSAGHLAMNHAVIEWLLSRGQQVTIILSRSRLRLPVERYDLAPVIGFGAGTWRRFIFATHPSAITAIIARLVLGLAPASLAGFLRRRARTQTYGSVDTVLGAFPTPEQAAWCAARIVQLAPDTVIIDTIFRAAILRDAAIEPFCSVIIAHDVFYRRHGALLAAGYSVHPAVLSRDMEADLLNRADVIAAIQPEEAGLLAAMAPSRLVCTAPMPAIACPRPAATARLSGRLVFVGSASLPNVDGLRWFFAEIWPALRGSANVSLDLAGDCGTAIGRLPPGVRRLGRVKNLAAILHRSALAIAPLRVGSGLKIKILDYARHGLITVATPESLLGFAAGAEAPFIIAPDAAAFSAAIAVKLQTADKADEARALRYITTHYSSERSFSDLAKALNVPSKPEDSQLA